VVDMPPGTSNQILAPGGQHVAGTGNPILILATGSQRMVGLVPGTINRNARPVWPPG
jgi:hypothetical protein